MTRAWAGVVIAALLPVVAASAQPAQPMDAVVGDLKSPNKDARLRALKQLGEAGYRESAVPVAAMLLDGSNDVQLAAIDALVGLYLVRRDLTSSYYAAPPTSGSRVLVEVAFEAGPFATLPGDVPAEALTALATVMRQDETPRVRQSAAYALGILAAPAMGSLPAAAAPRVEADLLLALQHLEVGTRQVAARVIGRVYEARPGQAPWVSQAAGDAVIGALNDKDANVRLWASDSLGRMRYDRAIQALTDRASFHGRTAEGEAALHALARIASPTSTPILQALLVSQHVPFRVISLEGLGRMGDTKIVPAMQAALGTETNDGVRLAAAMAYYLLGEPANVAQIADALQKPGLSVQARLYLIEIGLRAPAAIVPLLQTPGPETRRLAADILGISGAPEAVGPLEGLLKDTNADVVQAASEAIRRLRAGGAPAAR